MSFLYVIRCGDYHKIGIASNMKSRLSSLQTGNPVKLQLITHYEFENPEPIEQAIHQKFVKKNVSGEWFSLDKNDLSTLDSICKMFDGTVVLEKPEITNENTNKAEVIGEITDSISQDAQLQKLTEDGWRIEFHSKPTVDGGRASYWYLAKTEMQSGKNGGNRLRQYGGRVLPDGTLVKSTNKRGGVRGEKRNKRPKIA